MTPEAFRKLALSLPDAVEGSHMRHADFRVGGKIFASLGYPDADHGCVMLLPEEQEMFMAEAPDCFSPSAGAWGLRGATNVRLKSAKSAILKSALHAAWQRRATTAKPAAKKSKPKR